MDKILDLLNDENSIIYKKSYEDNEKQSRVQIALKKFLGTIDGWAFYDFLPKLYELDFSVMNVIKLRHPIEYISDSKYSRLIRELMKIYSIVSGKPLLYLSHIKFTKIKIEKGEYANDIPNIPFHLDITFYKVFRKVNVEEGCSYFLINRENENRINIRDGTKYNVSITHLDGSVTEPIRKHKDCIDERKIINFDLNVVFEYNITDLELNLIQKPRLFDKKRKDIYNKTECISAYTYRKYSKLTQHQYP